MKSIAAGNRAVPQGTGTTESRLKGADSIGALACLIVLAHHLTQRLAPEAITQCRLLLGVAVTGVAL